MGGVREETGLQAVRLDQELILEAAERIVGSEGLNALTMRRIGGELRADPTAVYRHFRNKEELLTRLAERMFYTMPTVDPDLSWQDQLRAHVRHAFERYSVHPDLAILLARQPDDIPSLMLLTEHTLEVLVNGAGLSFAQAGEINQLLEHHIVGCGLFFAISEYRDPVINDLPALRRAYALLPSDQYPLASQAAPYLFPDPDAMFDRTTDLLIETIERMAAAGGDTEET